MMEEPVEPVIDPLEQFRQYVEAELSAEALIEELLIRGADVLYDKYLEQKNVPFAVGQVIGLLVNAMELEHIRRDTGEAEVWAEETEPVPCTIDTWGRAAVPVKKKYKLVQTRPPTSNHGEVSFRSQISSITRVSRVMKSRLSPTTKNTPLVEERHHSPIPIPQQHNEISAEEDTLRLGKEIEAKRKAEEEDRVLKARLAEEERIREANKRAQDLRNKPYTYDYEGRIVILKHVLDSKASMGDTEFKLQVEEPVLDKKKNVVRREAVKKDLPTIKSKRPPDSDIEFVKNIQSGQPPLFDNIRLSAGVIVSEGNRVRHSPSKQKPKTLTKSQYRLMAETPGLMQSQSSFTSSIKSSRNDPRELKDDLPKSQVVTSNKELLSEIPDIEEDEYQQDVSQQPSAIKSKSAKQMTPITVFGEGVEEGEGLSEVDQFNFQILRSKNWGSNPPIKDPNIPTRLPKAHSSRRLIETLGYRSRFPRERPFIETATTRSHLPPHPLGKSLSQGLLHLQPDLMASLRTDRSRKD